MHKHIALALALLGLGSTPALAWHNKYNASPHAIGFGYSNHGSGGAIKTTSLGMDANGNRLLRVQHDGLDRVQIREARTNKFLGYKSITR